MIGNYRDSTMVSIFRGTDQPPTRRALLTPNWRGCEGTACSARCAPRPHGDRLALPVRAAWLRPKQTDLVPGKGAVPLAFPPIRSATVVRQRFFGIPATDTNIISAQHFWTGELETAGPVCYDAVAIA